MASFNPTIFDLNSIRVIPRIDGEFQMFYKNNTDTFLYTITSSSGGTVFSPSTLISAEAVGSSITAVQSLNGEFNVAYSKTSNGSARFLSTVSGVWGTAIVPGTTDWTGLGVLSLSQNPDGSILMSIGGSGQSYGSYFSILPYMKIGAGTVRGSLWGTYTQDAMFKIVAPFIPTVGSQMIVSGGFGTQSVSRAYRTSTTMINFYSSVGSYFQINSGSATNAAACSISW